MYVLLRREIKLSLNSPFNICTSGWFKVYGYTSVGFPPFLQS